MLLQFIYLKISLAGYKLFYVLEYPKYVSSLSSDNKSLLLKDLDNLIATPPSCEWLNAMVWRRLSFHF